MSVSQRVEDPLVEGRLFAIQQLLERGVPEVHAQLREALTDLDRLRDLVLNLYRRPSGFRSNPVYAYTVESSGPQGVVHAPSDSLPSAKIEDDFVVLDPGGSP